MIFEELLFPRRCPFCDEIIRGYKETCDECESIPFRIKPPYCKKCGKHINNSDDLYCYDCSKNERSFIKGISLYEYDSVKESILTMKASFRPQTAEYYGKKLAEELGTELRLLNVDAIVPIPLHKKKQKKRGYNQCELMAEPLSDMLNIPIRTDLLSRVKETKEQKKMGKNERQNNLVGAFHMQGNDVKLNTVLLLDDVYTTGATMENATRALHEGGVKNVYAVTAAIGADDKRG